MPLGPGMQALRQRAQRVEGWMWGPTVQACKSSEHLPCGSQAQGPQAPKVQALIALPCGPEAEGFPSPSRASSQSFWPLASKVAVLKPWQSSHLGAEE